MNLTELEKKITPVFEKHDIAKHQMKMTGGKNATLEIMIMKKDGSMDMQTCEAVSRDISAILDEIDFGNEPYNLDVCSFGAERVLESLDEVRNEISNWLHIELRNPKEGLDKFEGTLLSEADGKLEIEYFVKGRRKTVVVDYDNISLIRLAVKL